MFLRIAITKRFYRLHLCGNHINVRKVKGNSATFVNPNYVDMMLHFYLHHLGLVRLHNIDVEATEFFKTFDNKLANTYTISFSAMGITHVPLLIGQ